MAKIDLAYDLVNYTPANAAPVGANFDRIEQHINQELVERDGEVAMRAQLKLVGDPLAALDAAPKQYVDQVLPIGLILMYGGAGAPGGGKWMACNGAELQTADYPALYKVLGSRFNAEDTPSGRFRLPNLRDRFPMGAGTSTTVGEIGGYRTSQLPAHTHGLANHHHTIDHNHGSATSSTIGDHNHNIAGGTLLMRSGGSGAGATGTAAFGTSTWNLDGGHSHSVNLPAYSGNSGTPDNNTSQEVGVDPTDRNLPPYVGVQYVIRVL